MADEGNVSLRDYFERVIADHENSTQQALRIQAAETSRRLHELNNEAARLQAAVSVNVSADTWTAFTKSYEERHKTLEDRMSRIEGFQSRILGAVGLAVLFVPAATAIAVRAFT